MPGADPNADAAIPACCARAIAEEAAALHPVDPVLARIQRTLGPPRFHPTDHGLPWAPCSLDCPESAARAIPLVRPVEIAVPPELPFATRALDPAVAVGRRPARVVVLDLQRGETDFMGSVELQFAAADLARCGHHAELVRVYVDITGRRFDDGAQQALADRFARDGVALVLARTHVWDGFLAMLRAAGIRAGFLPQPGWRDAVADAGAYDMALPPADRQGLVAAVDRFAATGELRAEPHPRVDGFPPAYLPLPWYWPAVRYRHGLTGEIAPFRRLMLLHNTGCPWSADVADVADYDGLDLGPSVLRRGCTYCAIGGDYRKLPVPDYIGFLVAQIGWLGARAPDAELVLSDEASFSFFGELVQRLADAGIRPGPLLIKARMNGLLAILPRFEAHLEVARRAGIRIVVYLLGIESFSDRALTLYNKGITADRLAQGLGELLALEARFPETFSATRYNSHGFILFNPWTTLDDVRVNLARFRELDIARFAGKAVWSRLRLYTWQPLYALAERDGLLDDGARFAEVVERQVGYHGDERPWRFADPRVELCYFLVTRGREAHPNPDAAGVEILARALARAEAAEVDGPLSADALERERAAMIADAPALFADRSGLDRARSRVQAAMDELARRSERLRWALVAVEPAPDGFRVRFARRDEALAGTLSASGDRVAWEPAGSRSAALFGQALALALQSA